MCSNVLYKIKMSVQCLNDWRNEYLIKNNIQNGHLIKKYLDTLMLARGISFLKIKVYSKKAWQRLRESPHSFIVISQWSRNFAHDTLQTLTFGVFPEFFIKSKFCLNIEANKILKKDLDISWSEVKWSRSVISDSLRPHSL